MWSVAMSSHSASDQVIASAILLGALALLAHSFSLPWEKEKPIMLFEWLAVITQNRCLVCT